jgi:hypothetical protein
MGERRMRFCVSYGNHGNGVHVEDIVVHIRNALRAGGQEAHLLPNLLRDGVNVVLECFTPRQASQIRQLREGTKARFVVVVSEFTDGKTFNPHITSGKGHYVDLAMWKQRFEAFVDVASRAEAIWTLSGYQVPQYRKLFPDKPVLPFPVGFDPFFAPPRLTPPESRDIDLLFTGNETPYRKEMIDRLSEKYCVTSCSVFTLTASRIDMINRAKASLHLNLAKEQSYTSIMRHHFLVMNASPVLSERAEFPGELDDFVTHLNGVTFAADAGDYLASGRWRNAGQEAYERYRENRPLGPLVKGLLAESFRT